MYFGDDVDCEECANYKDWSTCEDCIHNEDHYDHFIQANPEILAKMAEDQKRRFLDSIKKEEISIDPNPIFMEKLSQAWRFVPKIEREHKQLFCAYCGQDREGYLMATDGYRLVKINVDHHEQFVGKHLILDDIENKIYALPIDFSSPLSNGSAQGLLDKIDGARIKFFKDTVPFKEMIPGDGVEKEDPQILIGNIVRIKKRYIDEILDCIPDFDEITLTYGGKVDSVGIDSQVFKALIMPIRY